MTHTESMQPDSVFTCILLSARHIKHVQMKVEDLNAIHILRNVSVGCAVFEVVSKVTFE